MTTAPTPPIEHQPKSPSLKLWLYVLIWIGLVLVPFIVAPTVGAGAPAPGATTLPDLQVFTSTTRPYALWERKEAVAFGLGQMSNQLNAELLGAATILWFAVKFLNDPEGKGPPQPKCVIVLFWNVALGACYSLMFGFLAMLYLTELPTRPGISLDGDIKACASAQILSLGFTAVLMLFGLAIAASRRWKEQGCPC